MKSGRVIWNVLVGYTLLVPGLAQRPISNSDLLDGHVVRLQGEALLKNGRKYTVYRLKTSYDTKRLKFTDDVSKLRNYAGIYANPDPVWAKHVSFPEVKRIDFPDLTRDENKIVNRVGSKLDGNVRKVNLTLQDGTRRDNVFLLIGEDTAWITTGKAGPLAGSFFDKKLVSVVFN